MQIASTARIKCKNNMANNGRIMAQMVCCHDFITDTLLHHSIMYLPTSHYSYMNRFGYFSQPESIDVANRLKEIQPTVLLDFSQMLRKLFSCSAF